MGANVGVFYVLAAARGARMTVLEPHPDPFAWLERNATPFGVECRRAGVVGQVPTSGEVRLVRAPGGGDTGHHSGGLRADDAGLPGVCVPATSFSDLLAEGYGLVKLDVGAGEFELLAGTPLDALAGLRRLVAEVDREVGELAALRARLVVSGMTVAVREDPSDPADALISARR